MEDGTEQPDGAVSKPAARQALPQPIATTVLKMETHNTSAMIRPAVLGSRLEVWFSSLRRAHRMG